MSTAERHPIKVAARRSGLSPHVIRVWERRYQAVAPQRSATNRRQYTNEEIERLRLLRLVIESGYSIGEIARFPEERLSALIAAAGGIAAPPRKPDAKKSNNAAVQALLDECLAAVRSLDAEALEEILARSAAGLSRPDLLGRLIEPVLNRIGDMWQGGTLRPAHEHLATAVVRSFLGGFVNGGAAPPSAPEMIVTTPAGQLHEMGALIAASAAQAEGWRALYLGPNLPAEEIAAAARQNRARAVALSIVYPPDDPRLGGEFAKLRRLLPPDAAVFVGGRAAGAYAEALNEIEAICVGDIFQFRRRLAGLRSIQPE